MTKPVSSRQATADPVYLCLAFDRGFIAHAAVTLLSARQAASKATRITAHILQTGDISEADRSMLQKTVPDIELRWHEIAAETFETLPDNREHVSRATYLRLAIPSTLKGVTPRVIYLDCDTVVTDDLAVLYDLDMHGLPIAAAADEGGKTQGARLGLSTQSFYFNAGILIFDLDGIDPDDFDRRVDEVVSIHLDRLELQDQDILNLMFAGQTHRLHLRWNANTRLYTPNDFEPGYTDGEAQQAVAAPGILHFTDKRKPWSAKCNHPRRDLYWHFRNQTPWRETALQGLGRRFKNAIRDRFSKSRRAARAKT
ncbi:glycosyltransferase family 8 protein [Roseobacter weihaiensis]|uniref:glycosyltransferase family 8 protein n=1 Tax=Roseobacter weihaiensis TaxID=2763262 RepID=UPI001D09FE1C|nr:glycosyltransferase family 8 protein [Roseobacter sp. H9]